MKAKLKAVLRECLKTKGFEDVEIEISYPQHDKQGDFSTSVALKLAKQSKKNPIDLARELVSGISDEIIEKTEVLPPGFINFFIKPDALLKELQQVSKKPKGEAVLLEFGQPNTHKTPHIGHLFSYIYGEALARIFEQNGNTVTRLNYQGDIGLHVAKCLWGITEAYVQENGTKTLADRIRFLQQSYQEGADAYEKDPKAKAEIDELNTKLYEGDSSVSDIWKETRAWSLEYYKEFEKKLGITYDRYYFESETSALGKEIVLKNIGNVFEKSEGAIVFRGDKHDLHTRVFINKNGNPTYEAKDIGLITKKRKDFSFDSSVVTTASEQNGYWKVVLKASELLYPDLVGKLKHLGYGMINLASGKMSSRTGAIVDAFELVAQVTEKIKKEYKTDQNLSEKIALSAIKYSFLKSDAFKNIVFDIEKSIAKEGDSGPYLLYTYVRVQSLLTKAETPKNITLPKHLEPEEKDLLKKLARFNEVVQQAQQSFLPHIITQYIYTLAQTFNLFYQKHQVLKAEKESLSLRLFLTDQTGHVIKTGLGLLGIETVEKM